MELFFAFLSSVFSLLNGKLVQSNQPSVISFYELLTGVVFISVYLFIQRDFSLIFFQLKSSNWIYLLILGVVCTAYAFIISVKVMKFISPYTVMLSVNMEPVYGIILAYLILGDSEKMNPQFYLGAVIILCTVVVNGIIKNKRKRKQLEFD